MCPACLGTAALIAASLGSTGVFAAIAVRAFGAKNVTHPVPAQTQSKEESHG